MGDLTFTDGLAALFAQLVLAAGVSVAVVLALIGWTVDAMGSAGGTPDE